MTLSDLFEVDSGVLKEVKFKGDVYDIAEFLVVNIISKPIIPPEEYKVINLYLPKIGRGIGVELEINTKKED